MAEVICNTSPLQYLHQLGLLHLLPALAGTVIVPEAVAEELAIGRAKGIDLPDISGLAWISVRGAISASALTLINDLGPGETEVLLLALEREDAVVILDDRLARRIAEVRGIRLIGTLGILLDAKRAGLIPAVAPVLDQLGALRFRLGEMTRRAVLKLAGEVNSDPIEPRS